MPPTRPKSTMIGFATQHPASIVSHTCLTVGTKATQGASTPLRQQHVITGHDTYGCYTRARATQARANHVQVMHSFGKTTEITFLSDSAHSQPGNPRLFPGCGSGRFSNWTMHTSPPYLSTTTYPNNIIYALGASPRSPLLPRAKKVMILYSKYKRCDEGVRFFSFL